MMAAAPLAPVPPVAPVRAGTSPTGSFSPCAQAQATLKSARPPQQAGRGGWKH
jgi:hypothetical protein